MTSSRLAPHPTRPRLRLRRVLAALAAAIAVIGGPGPFAPPPAAALGNIILVTTTSDAEFPGDGLCSLRAAILASNVGGLAGYCDPGSAGSDSIRFSVGSGTPVINVGSSLPDITQPVTLRGNTGGATSVRIHGPGSGTGLNVTSGATATTIRGMVIDGFTAGIVSTAASVTIAGNVVGPNGSTGIQSSGAGSVIGGLTGVTPGGACTGDCNLVAGNQTGIAVGGSGTVLGNSVGTNAAGTAAEPNGVGISVSGSVTVGGTAVGAGNLVSGNQLEGVSLQVCACTVQGNRIGTTAAGTAALANHGPGIHVINSSGTIGGTVAGAANVISGNAGGGIEVAYVTSPLTIAGNRIGVTATGGSLPNLGDGIFTEPNPGYVAQLVIGSPTDPAAANVIAHNAGAGIHLYSEGSTPAGQIAQNRFRGNSIFSNAGFGIVLGGGTNAGIQPPLVTSLGPVTGTACAQCFVDVYSDNAEEGRIFEGTVLSDPQGHWVFDGLFAGPSVTATATDFQNNTSAFSAPFAIPAPPFTDIATSAFKSEIAWLYANGITTGCSATKYCPAAAVTREQMASFLARELRLASTATDYFTDDEASTHEDNINRLAAAGITSGCAPQLFCPTGLVLRDQMASFLARAAGLTVGAGRDYFTDDDGNTHEANIDKAAAAGITTGCGSFLYCPANSVTREQMAAFLRRLIAPVAPPPLPTP